MPPDTHETALAERRPYPIPTPAFFITLSFQPENDVLISQLQSGLACTDIWVEPSSPSEVFPTWSMGWTIMFTFWRAYGRIRPCRTLCAASKQTLPADPPHFSVSSRFRLAGWLWGIHRQPVAEIQGGDVRCQPRRTSPEDVFSRGTRGAVEIASDRIR